MSRLTRWSRRKRGDTVVETAEPSSSISFSESAAASEAPSTEDDYLDEPALASAPRVDQLDDEEQPGDSPSLDETLPAPESLQAGSDFTAYLKQGVSQGLRRRALRQLFATGGYNVRDGLDDYDQDFRQQRPLSADIAARLRQWTQTLETTEETEATAEVGEQPTAADEQHDAATEEESIETALDESTDHGASLEEPSTHRSIDNG